MSLLLLLRPSFLPTPGSDPGDSYTYESTSGHPGWYTVDSKLKRRPTDQALLAIVVALWE